MKHTLGSSSPMCCDCRYFRAGNPEDKFKAYRDGWCTNPKAQGINNRKPPVLRDRIPTYSKGCCQHWIDGGEEGYTHFEVMTGIKEPVDDNMTKLPFYDQLFNTGVSE